MEAPRYDTPFWVNAQGFSLGVQGHPGPSKGIGDFFSSDMDVTHLVAP